MTIAAAAPPAAIEDSTPTTSALESLTDEELAVLTREPSLVVSPFLDRLPDSERTPALRTALRGLVARGIVDLPAGSAVDPYAEPQTELRADDPVGVDVLVRQDVLSTLTLREAAPATVAVARTTASAQDFWYAHVVEEFVVVESVAADGLHHFCLGRRHDLLALVIAAAVHPEAVAGNGPPVALTGTEATLAPVELVDRLGAAHLRADIVVVEANEVQAAPRRRPVLTGLYTGPDGSWSVTADPGSQTVTASPQDRIGLRTVVGSLLRPLVEEG